MNPAARAVELFRRTYGREPAVVASAPGRVNLIGEHVDYHGGHVLPVAIAQRTAVAVGAAEGFAAVSEQGTAERRGWLPERAGSWSDYVAGVARFLAERRPGARGADGLAVAVASDVPVGAGLSSSAALEVAAAAALAALWRLELDGRGLADLAHRAETDFVGVPCGVMDQMAAALAPERSALLIDCATLETRAVPAGVELIVVDSGESHALRAGAYAQRRREGDEALAALRKAWPDLRHLVEIRAERLEEAAAKLPDVLARRVRHVVEENQRALKAAGALESGDLALFGALVNASHESLRVLYECSTPQLDRIVETARSIGSVLGARLVGAGWGGSALVVVSPRHGAVAEALSRLRSVLGGGPDAVRRIETGCAARVEST